MDQSLRERRGDLERSWRAAIADGSPDAPARPEVLRSWRRSSRSVSPELTAAPATVPDDVEARWSQSRLGRASRVILDDLDDLAETGDMMAAITDASVTIAWIAGGRSMTRLADRVHFSLGGCWAEESVGTNALALAQHDGRPATVFSAEHFAPMVHDWVCYSAPILDPESGRSLGVLDLSTTWQRAHSTLLTTVSALARCVEYEIATLDGPDRSRRRPAAVGSASPSRTPAGGRWRAGGGVGLTGRRGRAGGGLTGGGGLNGGMVLRTLGSPAVWVDGRVASVTRRQLELLTVLSLHPEGLSRDELTARVYGDHPVSPSTVKAELSHLRHLLGGRIGSRPYRLVGPVESDHHRLLDALTAGDVAAAVDLYRGPMFTSSDSPEIESWRNHVDVAIRDAVISARQPDLLWDLGTRCREDVEVHAATLDALDPGDSRRSVVTGRLAAAKTV